jgi:long-chain-acyl-CoA dehydrogenase
MTMLDTSRRTTFTAEHEMFREQVRRFFERELIPHLDRWESQGIIDRDFWTKSGEAGLLCPNVPETYGGLGLDFGFNAVIDEELGYAGSSAGISLHSDIVAPYILAYGSEAQKRHWLPRMISGETPTAIAMTEPGAGSDLQAIRTVAVKDGDDYLINGSKTYITNGQHADLVILAAKTDPSEGAKGISLILVESDRPGFGRGRNLDKIGLHGQDTSELFFQDLRVPQANRLGAEGMGFAYLMNQLPQERLAIAIGAQAVAQRASTRRSASPASARRSAARSSSSRIRASPSPTSPRGCRSAGRISIGRWAGIWRERSPPPKPPPPSSGTRSSSGTYAMRRCSSMAGPAT